MVRQTVLGRELASRGVEVVLAGSVRGPQWVAEMLRNEKEILWSPLDEASFDAEDLKGAVQGAVVVVDSYLFGKSEYDQLSKSGARVVQFWDGPWQAMLGPTVIAPILDFSSALVRAPKQGTLQVLGGPEFIMIRPEIKEVGRRRSNKNLMSALRIVVMFGGGSDQTHIGWVVSAIRRASLPCEVDIFTTFPNEQKHSHTEFGPRIRFHPAGSQILPFLEQASLAISAAGTTAMELIYLGIPSIFIPVVANQSETARSISDLGIGKVIHPDDLERESQMVEEILRHAHLFQVGRTGFNGRKHKYLPIDGEGARRTANVILSPVLEQ